MSRPTLSLSNGNQHRVKWVPGVGKARLPHLCTCGSRGAPSCANSTVLHCNRSKHPKHPCRSRFTNEPCPPTPCLHDQSDQGVPSGVTALTAEMPAPWPCAATPWPCLFRSRYGLRRVTAGGGGVLLVSVPTLLSTCAQPSTVTRPAGAHGSCALRDRCACRLSLPQNLNMLGECKRCYLEPDAHAHHAVHAI